MVGISTPGEDSMRRLALVILVLGLVSAACSGSTTDTTARDEQSSATTSTVEVTTTTTATPTTTAAPETTTTTAASTTTVALEAAVVPPTPVVGVLDPYSPGGADLFAPGAVEAHWYQWDGLYVVLYRGFDASDGTPICAGNSILETGAGWTHITDSPHAGEVDKICIDAVRIAEAPSGVFACDTLLYYVTEIPTDLGGDLFGTLEIGDGEWNGQTSQAPADLAGTPEFEPGMAAYELPQTDVDPGGVVVCS